MSVLSFQGILLGLIEVVFKWLHTIQINEKLLMQIEDTSGILALALLAT